MTSWTHLSSTTSTKPTLIAPLPGDAAVRAVDPGHQEMPVGEGVMSRNNLHLQSNQPPTPAHNHQSTNHEHLQSLTTTIHKLTHLSHSPAGLEVAWLTTLVDIRLSARPSWNSSLPVEMQVYLQWYCTSCFQCTLHYLSYVGSPAWVTLNKLPFDSQLPVCLLDQYVTKGGVFVLKRMTMS